MAHGDPRPWEDPRGADPRPVTAEDQARTDEYLRRMSDGASSSEKITLSCEPVDDIEDLVRRLLLALGEDPKREGLMETPRRVAKAWREWTSGYNTRPEDVLKVFEDGAPDGGLVIVSNIPVVSRCEHHLAEISGIAHVGYIPRGRVVGLSKLARLVDVFGRRLQVQERLTNQVADALMKHLDPIGVGVVIRAKHGCMSTRGVRIHGSVTTTSAMRGAMLHNEAARLEFLNLCRDAEAHRE